MNKLSKVRELFNKYLEIVESTSYRISYWNKTQLINDLEEMIEQDKEIKELDKEEWINLFKNNSKEEILERLIEHKFPL